MFEKMDHAHSAALSEIIKTRHSVRAFSNKPLKKEDVEQILEAGLTAPFASISVAGKPDYRRFYVIMGDSPAKEKVKNAIVQRFPGYLEGLEKAAADTPFVKMLKVNGTKMIAGLFDKPCIVIAAERWGVPAIAPESISYGLENIWLKATTMGIGLQLLSVVPGMKLGNDEEFCKILGIPAGVYYLDCFALGYPAEDFKPIPVKYPEVKASVTWL